MSIFNSHLVPQKSSSNQILSFQDEMKRFFDRFNEGFDLGGDFNLPKIEISDKEKQYQVRAEIPGLSEKDIQVNLRDNVLTLEGERKSEFKEEKDGRVVSEFSYGSFYREIPLHSEVNPDTVKANYKNGILSISLDKVEESGQKVKKITINKAA